MILRRGLIVVVILAAFLVGGCQEAASPPPSSPPGPPLAQDFFLAVTEPQDESVVDTSPIRVSGSTSSGAEVSVNGELIDVDEQGNFAAMVEMEEGPNVVEVIATDYEGNEDYRILTVIYAP